MDLAPDFDEFIGSLIAQRAEFLVVGAYPLAFPGAPRFTGDIDFFVRPTIENAERVLAAVRAFGFPASELDAKALSDPRRILQMGGRTGADSRDERHQRRHVGRGVAEPRAGTLRRP